MSKRVLIAGASIAGPALAYWMARYGWDVVVQERAETLREGGQNIDVRGAARDVIDKMGLDDQLREATTGEEGTRFENADGSVIAAFPVGDSSKSGGATSEREILRGDLADLLINASQQQGAAYRFGDRITAFARNTDEGDVQVSFENAADETFDLVIAADGVRSSTRDLLFGEEVSFRPLELHITYGTIPRTVADVSWWRWYNALGGRSITLRPDNKGTIRAALTAQGGATAGSERFSSPQERMSWLEATFADAGWEARRILDGFRDCADLYDDSVAQVHAPRWSNHRVGLVGDAAYCATPVSGMGTSLSLVGAYVLAGELAAHVDHRDGFAGYERLMRPYVNQAQQLPPGTPRLAHPRTRAGIGVMALALRIGASGIGGALGDRLFAPPADKITLPDYRHLEIARRP